jgi:hypothetical protein
MRKHEGCAAEGLEGNASYLHQRVPCGLLTGSGAARSRLHTDMAMIIGHQVTACSISRASLSGCSYNRPYDEGSSMSGACVPGLGP